MKRINLLIYWSAFIESSVCAKYYKLYVVTDLLLTTAIIAMLVDFIKFNKLINCKTHPDIEDVKIVLLRADKMWYYSHFTGKETEAEKLGNLCKVTLVNRRAEIQLNSLAPEMVHLIIVLCHLSVHMNLRRE